MTETPGAELIDDSDISDDGRKGVLSSNNSMGAVHVTVLRKNGCSGITGGTCFCKNRGSTQRRESFSIYV